MVKDRPASVSLGDLTFHLESVASLLILLPPSGWPPALFCFLIQHFDPNRDKPPSRVSVLWEESLVVRASRAILPGSESQFPTINKLCDLGKSIRLSVALHQFPQW